MGGLRGAGRRPDGSFTTGSVLGILVILALLFGAMLAYVLFL